MNANESTSPSASRILFTDYWSFLLLLLQVGAVVTVYGIPALLLLTPLSVHRVRTIRRTFAMGADTEAVVVHRSFHRALWTATYEFEAGGRTVRTRDDYLAFKMPIQVGDRFPVVYDPERPERAYLKPFFLKSRG